MLLYDVVYQDSQSFDSNTTLPRPSKDIKYAKNTNGDGHYMVVKDGEWMEMSRQEWDQYQANLNRREERRERERREKKAERAWARVERNVLGQYAHMYSSEDREKVKVAIYERLVRGREIPSSLLGKNSFFSAIRAENICRDEEQKVVRL